MIVQCNDDVGRHTDELDCDHGGYGFGQWNL